MSADNYTSCPNCFLLEKQRQDAAIKSAADAYGKVPPEEYESLRKNANQRKLEDTVGEYYEIGLNGKGFFVSYCCRCSECGFEHRFQGSAPVKLKARGDR